jgi:hypothetical protein
MGRLSRLGGKMSAVCTRLVAFAGPTADPQDPTDPQQLLVQGRVGVNIEPTIIKQGPAPLAGTTDFWDVLVYPIFDKSPYVVLHEAELQDDGSIIIKRDLFGPGDYPLTWAGWPIPGDPPPPPEGEPTATPPTVVLTPMERSALAYVRKAKRKGVKP